eukprot:TRINITY_DN6711_c0_g1_i1.p1 TRINITY_DN6711_c0_g1~~TRINITY_DN6711_c0_g1_i1.p1  ORF type:complete len:549 (+),score=98.36 TRINITY_DN6711_c0_g1_i1:211-1857(+)
MSRIRCILLTLGCVGAALLEEESQASYFDSPEGTAIFTLWCLYSPFFFVILALFVVRRNLYPIKQREPLLLGLSAIGGYLLLTSYVWEAFVTVQKYPCILAHWTIWVLIPSYFLPYPLRAFRLIFIFKLNWAKYNIGLLEITSLNQSQPGGTIRSRKSFFARSESTLSNLSLMPDANRDSAIVTDMERGLSAPPSRDRAISESPEKGSRSFSSQESSRSLTSDATASAKPSILYDLSSVNPESSAPDDQTFFLRYKHLFLKVGRLLWVFLFLSFTVGMIRQFTQKSNYPWNTNCQASTLFFSVSFTFFALFIVALIVAIVFMRNVKDEFNITRELQIVCVTWVLLIVPYLVIKLVYALREVEPPFRPVWFLLVSTAVSFATSIFWPVVRTFFPEPEVSWPGCDIVSSLESVIENKLSRQTFNQFLVAEWSVENLLFYLDVKNFKTLKTSRQITQRSNEIYQKYFAAGAVCEVNLDAGILNGIHQEFAKNTQDKETLLNVFNDAEQACFALMKESSFPRFKKHQLCRELVQRLEKEEARKRTLQSLNLI